MRQAYDDYLALLARCRLAEMEAQRLQALVDTYRQEMTALQSIVVKQDVFHVRSVAAYRGHESRRKNKIRLPSESV